MQRNKRFQQEITSRGVQTRAAKSRGHGDRVAFTPSEFAAGFGRSETWGYRQIYSGRVKVVKVSGRLLVPKAEIDRLLAEAEIYSGDPNRAPKTKRSFEKMTSGAEGTCDTSNPQTQGNTPI